MVDEIQNTTIICQGGLDSTQNHLNLSTNKPGSASRLVNYEVGLNGGYRRLNGFTEYDATYPEVGVGSAEGAVLGIVIFPNSANGNFEIIAARKSSASAVYNYYLYEDGVGWTAITTGITHNMTVSSNTVERIQATVFNDGTKNIVCFCDETNKAVLYDGTNWVEIDSSNTGADFANAGGAQAIDAPAKSVFFRNTLFLFSDRVNAEKGIIAHSAPAEYYKFTSAGGGGQIPAGFDIVDAASFRDKLYVFGFNGIKYVELNDSATFVIKDVTFNIGCVARGSVQEIGGDLIFMSQDGFRPISGTSEIGDVQLEVLSKPIQSTYRTALTALSLDKVKSVAIRGKSQARWFFDDGNTDVADAVGIIGGLRASDQTTGWEFGELLGFRVSCVDSAYINSTEYVLYGDYDGKVYQMESGNSLNGSNMISIYQTPYLDFGNTEIRKLYRKINLFIQGEGDLDMSLNVRFDWGNEQVANPVTYAVEVSSVTSQYGGVGVEYGGLGVVYGGFLEPYKPINIQGSGFSISASFVTNGTDFPHSIHGMTFEYSVKGRR